MWKKAIGLDGEIYDSESEARIADWLFENCIEYIPHKKLPKPSRQISDFYLPHYDLYVEYDGLLEVRKDNNLIRKYKFYEKHNLNFISINRKNWKEELYERILCS